MKKDLLLSAQIKKIFIPVALCLLLVFSVLQNTIGQVEMLIGGNMEDADAWNVSHLDSEEEAGYEFNSNNSCTFCEGGTLNVWADGTALSNILFWQEVTLKANTVYKVSGAFIDLTGGALNQFWCEILIGAVEPVDGEDYGNYQVRGFNTWNNCGPNVDGTFQDDGTCRGLSDRFFLPDSLGEEGTMYFCINVGMWTDGPEYPYDIVVDEISLLDSAATPPSVIEQIRVNTDELLKNYPNPFNEITTITYSVPERGDISLAVYNSLGKEVATLVNETKERGTYKVPFNASDLNSNLYFCRLKMNDKVVTRKMILLK